MFIFVIGSPIFVICVLIGAILGAKIGGAAEKNPEKVGTWIISVIGSIFLIMLLVLIVWVGASISHEYRIEKENYQNNHVEVDASTISLYSVSVGGKTYSTDRDYVVSNINSSDDIKVVVSRPNNSSYLHDLTEEEKDKIRSRFNAAITNTENLHNQLLNQKIDYQVQIGERRDSHIKKEPEIIETIKSSLTPDQVRIWERNLYFRNRILMNNDEYFTNRNTIEELNEQIITIGREISALQGQNYSGNLIEPTTHPEIVKLPDAPKGYSIMTYIIGAFILLLISIFSLFMTFPKKFDFPFGFSDIHKKFFKKEKPKKIKRKPVYQRKMVKSFTSYVDEILDNKIFNKTLPILSIILFFTTGSLGILILAGYQYTALFFILLPFAVIFTAMYWYLNIKNEQNFQKEYNSSVNDYVKEQRTIRREQRTIRREQRKLLLRAIELFNNSTFSMVENVKINPSIVEIEYKMLSENVMGNCSPIVENQFDEYGNIISSELLGYLIQIDYDSKYNFDVIAHELAHVVMFQLVGYHGHDELWQRAYEACGGQEKYWEGHNN